MGSIKAFARKLKDRLSFLLKAVCTQVAIFTYFTVSFLAGVPRNIYKATRSELLKNIMLFFAVPGLQLVIFTAQPVIFFLKLQGRHVDVADLTQHIIELKQKLREGTL